MTEAEPAIGGSLEMELLTWERLSEDKSERWRAFMPEGPWLIRD